jgi:hypothetical protein
MFVRFFARQMATTGDSPGRDGWQGAAAVSAAPGLHSCQASAAPSLCSAQCRDTMAPHSVTAESQDELWAAAARWQTTTRTVQHDTCALRDHSRWTCHTAANTAPHGSAAGPVVEGCGTGGTVAQVVTGGSAGRCVGNSSTHLFGTCRYSSE